MRKLGGSAGARWPHGSAVSVRATGVAQKPQPSRLAPRRSRPRLRRRRRRHRHHRRDAHHAAMSAVHRRRRRRRRCRARRRHRRAEQARTSAATDDDSAAHVHGRGIMIRVVVALLVVAAIFHLSMWKVVYDLSADPLRQRKIARRGRSFVECAEGCTRPLVTPHAAAVAVARRCARVSDRRTRMRGAVAVVRRAQSSRVHLT